MLYQQSVAILNVVRIAQIIHLIKLTLKVNEKNILKTLKTLSDFGIKVKKVNKNEFIVYGKQEYKPCVYNVEADFSQFAFPLHNLVR